ncbi:MAG: alginate lyase family protein, partial [Armatimonadetes bacterium]|nr:alginate lyase family protein [Armatimonadota bacterium]
LGSWEGWRKFVLPFHELGVSRSPVGWKKVDAVVLTASGWGNTPNPQAVVYFDDVRLIKMKKAQGPRLSDEEFFAMLDLSWPGLEKVAAAVKKGDYEKARAELLDYYRHREKPRWFFDWRKGPRKMGKPPRKGSDGWDYYATKIAVDWTGWRRIRLSKKDFGPSRKPIGWDWITYLRFNASGWGETPDPNTVLYFDDFRLVGPAGVVKLSDFDHGLGHWQGLELSDEQAHSGKKSGKWGNMVAVTSVSLPDPPVDWTQYEYLEFWAYSPRATGAKLTLVLDSDDLNFAAADAVMAHRWLKLHGKPYDLGPDIQWDIMPFKPDDPARTREWTWCGLNRMGQWVTLLRAYWACGDEAYARECVAQMMDWVKDCPVPLATSGNGSMCWRTIECGIRMGQTWPEVFFRLLPSPSFTPEACCTMVKSMVEHARHLMRWRTGGNWLTMECNGLGHVGILFPEFKEAAEWRNTAFSVLHEELNKQVYPDGAQVELTQGYHHVALHNFLGLYQFAELNEVPAPGDYAARLKKMFLADVYQTEPDWATPAFNDSGRVGIARYMEQAAELFPDEPVFRWAATGGTEGRPPKFTSHLFPYAGWCIMRSGWDRDDRYLCMEAGPFGYGHQHEDKLSFVMYGYGREHITDPGNYMYDASKWRRYVLSTRAHNTIRVDGHDQARRGLRETYVTKKPVEDLTWLSGNKLDFAAGVYDSGYGPGRRVRVTHRRQVVFVKPDYFVVVDRLEGEGTHEIESLFHFNHDEAEVQGTVVRTIDPETSNCLVAAAPVTGLQVRVVKGQTEPEVQGFMPAQKWHASWKNPQAKAPEHNKRQIPTAVLTLKAHLPVTLAYVVMPYPKGQQPQVSCRLLPVESQGTAVEVTLPGGKKQVVLIGTPGQATAAGDLRTTKQVAVFDLSGPKPGLVGEL